MRAILHRATCISLLVASAAIWYVALPAFGSRYNLVAAKRGDKSMAQYERFLRQSVDLDPDAGPASAELAILLALQKKPEGALSMHQQSMRSYRPVQAFVQLGNLQERNAELQQGKHKNALIESAAANYERALRMDPGNVSALERLLVQAYRKRDRKRLDELSVVLESLDWENLNGVYLRALVAETDNKPLALALYQRVLAAGKPKGRSLYNLPEVENRLRNIQSLLQERR